MDTTQPMQPRRSRPIAHLGSYPHPHLPPLLHRIQTSNHQSLQHSPLQSSPISHRSSIPHTFNPPHSRLSPQSLPLNQVLSYTASSEMTSPKPSPLHSAKQIKRTAMEDPPGMVRSLSTPSPTRTGKSKVLRTKNAFASSPPLPLLLRLFTLCETFRTRCFLQQGSGHGCAWCQRFSRSGMR